MFQHSDLSYPLSNHTMISHFRSHDPDPTLYPRVHKMFQIYIITTTLTTKNILQIEVFMKNPFTFMLSPLIFSSSYTRALVNTMHQNNIQNLQYSQTGSGNCYSTQYCGLILWYGPLVLFNVNFPSHTRFSFFETPCICIRAFYSVYLRVYTTWTSLTNVFNLKHSLSSIS